MSPSLLKQEGFNFFFYANEHEPKHIHVKKGNDFVKINLGTLEVKKNFFKQNELKKILKIVEANKTQFIRRWDEYFRS